MAGDDHDDAAGGFLDKLGLPHELTAVLGLAIACYIFEHVSTAMDPAMKMWTPQFLAYAGSFIALASSQLAAAYAGVHAVEAAVHFDIGFYYVYAGASDQGDNLGLYELISVILFLTWSLAISVVGYIEVALLWDKFEAIEATGNIVTIIDGYKYLALGCIVGMGAWISGMALGDSSAKLLGWYDSYADDTHSEAYDRTALRDDVNGTAIAQDFQYHFITLILTYLTVTAISLSAYVFGYIYIGGVAI